jgi:hypothetical protein
LRTATRELCVLDRHIAVVGNDGERLEDLFDVDLAGILTLARGKSDSCE